ncbi:MAG: phosphatase PAP2 family protein [Anaerolineales bacterium]
MQTLIDLGISIVIAIQSMGTWLTAPMQFFSNLGTENFFLIVLPLLYWCVDSSLGLQVGLILVTSDMVNYIFKLLIAGPRPYWVSSHVKALWPETTFGAPSGHAQNAMGIWGVIANYYKKVWFWIIAGLIIFLIGFSRIYLGAHFPHDVILGWGIGVILLFIFSRFWNQASTWMLSKTFREQVLYAFFASLIFILIGFSVATFRKNVVVPEQWISTALLVGTSVPVPVDPNGIFTSAGILFGLGTGAAWILQLGGYQPSGPAWKRFVCYLIGLVGILIFWMGLGAVFPRGDGFIFYSLRYIRYALVGWWVSGGAPWTFVKLKLIA